MRQFHQSGKAFIAIKNQSIGHEHERTLVHFLEQRTGGIIGALQRVNPLALRRGDHHRVDFAASDGI